MANIFTCSTGQRTISVLPSLSKRRVRLFSRDRTGPGVVIFLDPEDALRFTKAVLEVADEVAQTETF